MRGSLGYSGGSFGAGSKRGRGRLANFSDIAAGTEAAARELLSLLAAMRDPLPEIAARRRAMAEEDGEGEDE